MHEHVEHPDAYANAIERRIKNNRITGNRKRWLAADATRAALVEAIDRYLGGPLPPVFDNEDCSEPTPEQYVAHGAWQRERDRYFRVRGKASPFISAMRLSLLDWGHLTAGQEAAVRRFFDTDVERVKERADKREVARAAQAAVSTHVGVVGVRQVFTATIKARVALPDAGFDIVILNDAAGNVIVYKGNSIVAAKGDTISFKATVGRHEERDGVKQTIVKRPGKA